VRVIENNDVIEVTCSRCGSKLVVECEDVQTTDIGHGHSHMQWANCCQCGKEIGIPLEKIPSHWRAYLFVDDIHG